LENVVFGPEDSTPPLVLNVPDEVLIDEELIMEEEEGEMLDAAIDQAFPEGEADAPTA
jgi:hypothetical protein